MKGRYFLIDFCVKDNANRPEGIPPSMGGKYVGFGSSPPPNKTSKSTSDVGAFLYKGWGNFTQIAGTAAQQATAVVKTGAENLSSALKDTEMTDRVQTNAKVFAEKSKELGKQGWSGLRSMYASVASKVETVARDNGYSIDLGSSKTKAKTKQSDATFNNAAYSQLSRSESGGLDELLKKQRHVVHDETFAGFDDPDPSSPVDPLIPDKSENGHTLKDSKKGIGSKSAPIRSKNSKDWANWEDSEEETVDDDEWGKW